jgi:hypothetical protein
VIIEDMSSAKVFQLPFKDTSVIGRIRVFAQVRGARWHIILEMLRDMLSKRITGEEFLGIFGCLALFISTDI